MASDEPSLKLFDASLNKPIRTLALFQTVCRLFGREASNATTPARGAALVIADRFPLRILLAEDNPVNQRVASLSLARLGYRVDVANNGVEAVTAFNALHHDVILMDVRMPEMDGIEATQAIRKNAAERQPWIIGLSAGATKEERRIATLGGMDDFIAKPFRLDTLADCLQKAYLGVQQGKRPG